MLLQLSGTDASGGTWRRDHWPKGQRFHFGRLDIIQEYDAQGKVNTIYYIPRHGDGDGINWEEAQNFFHRNGVGDFNCYTWTAIGDDDWGGTVWASPDRHRFVMINRGFTWEDSHNVIRGPGDTVRLRVLRNQAGIGVGKIPRLHRLCILTLEGYINYDWTNRGPDWARLSYQ